jgi:hypothetical protein
VTATEFERSPRKKHGRRRPKQSARRVQFAPFFDRFAAFRTGILSRDFQQKLVHRQNGNEREGPIGKEQKAPASHRQSMPDRAVMILKRKPMIAKGACIAKPCL